MIDNEKYYIVITLLLIKKGDPFNNSYTLIRILERIFRTLETKAVLDQIKEKYYAEYSISNGLHYYKLTSKGSDLIEKEIKPTLDFALENFPSDEEVIKNLFN